MRLRNLFEALGKEVAFIFGRFNPPHKGHRAAWELASKSPIWYVGTNQSTQGPKDPLPYDVKIEAMKAIWPEVEGHIVAETSWLTMASMIYEKHGDVSLLCFTDEDWVTKTIQQYNGKEGAHGYYNFKNIEQRPTPRLSSATALRDAVIKGDRDAFSQAAGVDADTPVAGKPFFDLVAEYLLPYQNAPKKTAKKKVAQPAEGVAEGMAGMDDAEPYTIGGAVDKQYVYTVMRDGKSMGIYHSLDDAKSIVANNKRTNKYSEFKIQRKPRSKMAGPVGQLPEQDVAEGYEDDGKEREENLRYSRSRNPVADAIRKKLNPNQKEQNKEEGVAEGLFGLSTKEKAKIQYVTAKISDIPGNWDHANQRYTEQGLNDLKSVMKNEKYLKYALSLTSKDYEAEDAAGVGIITKQNTTKDVNKGTLRKMMKAYHLIDSMSKELAELTEAPIEMDPSEPMNPMIVGTKSNPAKLQYRMLRAANQLKDLAQRAQGAGASEWDMITRNFDELAMNIGEIKHALDELRKMRSKGGVRSRGIENF